MRMNRSLPLAVLLVVFCGVARAATFSISAAALPRPLIFIAYGDMRFTDPGEKLATNPVARRALVEKIAGDNPAALFINGDVTYHGIAEDYAVFREETASWRGKHTRVYPALGNHEFAACQAAECLERWWTAFPTLRDRRWYSVALGSRVLAVALDSTAPLLPGSEQQTWLAAQLDALDARVQVVLIVMHHPPVADVQTVRQVDHNPRPNEQALEQYLSAVALRSHARFVVSAGHIHNYERFERGGVTYLVSGGGGARPYEVDRTADDRYQNADFPNYHYVRFVLGERRLTGEMIRLNDADAAHPAQWQVRDRFAISLTP